MNMDQKLYEEVLYLMDEISNDTSVPRNIRKIAQDSKVRMEKKEESLDLRCARVISMMDDLTNDPNVPAHGRTFLYTIISKLEALAKS